MDYLDRLLGKHNNWQALVLLLDRLLFLLELLAAASHVRDVEEPAEQVDVRQFHQKTEGVNAPGGVHGVAESLEHSHVEENHKSDQELRDLGGRNESGDPSGTADRAGREEVVTVHHSMDAVRTAT